MSKLLVAHGTRKPNGVKMIGELAGRVSEQLGLPVHVAFVDVLGPTPEEVLRALPTDRSLWFPHSWPVATTSGSTCPRTWRPVVIAR